MSKSIDPLVVYGGVAYTWRPLAIKNIQSGGRDIDSLTLGDSFSVNAGIGFSLSYGVSLNLGYSLSHSFGSELEINGQTQKSTGQNQSVFTVGTSWRLSSGQYLNTSIGMGLTPQSPDFSINVSLPFEFSGF